jgi:hypothetical protein
MVEGTLLSLAFIAGVCILGLFGAAIGQAIVQATQTSGIHHLLAVATTCILGGFVTSVNQRMPNYASRPPVSALLQRLKAPALLALLSVSLTVCIALMLSNTPGMPGLSHLALNAALGLNVGIVLASLHISGSLTSQYRSACAWEDQIHPRHKGC